jgi:hypothetical protein
MLGIDASRVPQSLAPRFNDFGHGCEKIYAPTGSCSEPRIGEKPTNTKPYIVRKTLHTPVKSLAHIENMSDSKVIHHSGYPIAVCFELPG